MNKMNRCRRLGLLSIKTSSLSRVELLKQCGPPSGLTFHRLASSVRACIVGGGPAGYYTAQRLLKSNSDVEVDIVDKLPVPFGLVRFGVAPDHPEVKNVINTFTQTATRYRDRCTFIGNVEVGRDIQASQLLKYYDVVILNSAPPKQYKTDKSYGAEDDRKLGIKGESKPWTKLSAGPLGRWEVWSTEKPQVPDSYLLLDCGGVYSAREFVGWYNGVPEFSDLNPDLDKETAVILGQGNVALDIARLLLMPTEELAKTDVCQHALDAIAASKLKTVYIVGRRGPLQAAFTIKEFRELTKLPGVQSRVSPEAVKGIIIADLPRPRRRLTELMVKISAESTGRDHSKSWRLEFLLTPQEIMASGNHVTGVRFIKNQLTGEDVEAQKAIPTPEKLDIPCDLVIRSIGYQSLSIADSDVIPFDSKSFTIPNVHGRVVDRPGLYCSGWVKRGPVGVIATTMSDAFETADTVLEDIKSGVIKPSPEKNGLGGMLPNSGREVVNFSGWEKIDREEVKRGEKLGKPREKIVTVPEMVKIART